MAEQEESLGSALSKIGTLEELESVLPPTFVEKLGGGREGIDRAVGLLTALSIFAPAPATFSEEAFVNVFTDDPVTGGGLSQQEQKGMLDAALEAGFIQKAEKAEESLGDRYSVIKELQEAVKRAIAE